MSAKNKLMTPGKWFADFDENGNATETFYDESFRILLGFNEQEFSNTQESWSANVHPDDRDRVNDYFSDIMEKHPEGKDYDIEYRIMTKWGYRWFHDYARITRRENGSVIHFEGVTFDIQHIKDFEVQQAHDKLKNEVLDYIVNHDEDPIELLSQFAEKIRVILDCDQVIYRDLEKTRIMVNSPGIEKTWSVPFSYCLQCQHLDPHHPMYADGYTEMDNCQEGWKGIPVYHKCPIKSSLTRIVYCNGETAGYLAIHYVQKYHHFTEVERKTVEEFTRNFSLILSRYESGKRIKELKRKEEKQNLELVQNNRRVMALEDNFESLYDVELDSGRYVAYVKGDFYQTNVADKLLPPGDYFEDLRGNIDAVIYPEDRDGLYHVLERDSIRKALSETDRIEYVYRTFVGGAPVWFKIRIVYKDADKKNVIIGCFNADQEITERLQAEQLRQRLLDKMAGDDGVFLVDCVNDRRTVVHDRVHGAAEFGGGNIYSETSREYVNTFVMEADREKMHKEMSVANMLERLETEPEIMVQFRDITSGSPRFYEMRVVKLSDTELLQSFKDSNDKIQSMLLSDRLLSEYVSIYVVDLRDLSWKTYKRPGYMENEYPLGEDYRSSFGRYIASEVHPDDRDAVSVLADPEKLKERFKEHSNFTVTFRKISGEDVGHLRCEAIFSSDKTHVAFAFQDVSYEYEQQKREREEAEKTEKLISSISAAYNAAFVVNMKDDSFKLLRMDSFVLGCDLAYDNFSQAKDYFIANVCHPSDKAMVATELDYENIRKRLLTAESYDTEYRAVMNGNTDWWILNITRIDDDNIAAGFARKDIELTKLHLEEKRYNEYFALFIADIDRRMMKVVKNTEWFEEAREGESFPYSQMIGALANHFTGEQKEFFEKMADIDYAKDEMTEGEKRTYIYRSKNLDNRWVDVTSYVTLRHADGTPAEFTVGFSFADALSADRQELSRQIAKQKIELEDAYKMAQTASEAKSNFLFNMSHDIRTPMNAITGFTTMAKKYVENPHKVTDYLNKIDLAGQQLLMLINQVLEMARIESGKVEFEEAPVNIRERFDAMVTVLSEQAEVRGLEFHPALRDLRHPKVLADDARMGQITLNITGNAMKYTPEGGRIDFTVTEIPSRKEGYGTYVFSVADTGIGMSEDYIKNLYEPFSREKNTTVSQIQGTGLGLSIVKSLVDLAGGTIDVQSEPGKGTRFDVTVDLKLDGQEAVEVIPEKAAATFNFKGKRALLVEDNELNREIAKFILEDKGVIVEDAEDGEVAVEKILRIASEDEIHYYDFILMDVQMPRMNGYQATARIREILAPLGAHIPIVALSANAFEEDKQKSREAGMDDHIAKPIDIDLLLATLAKYL